MLTRREQVLFILVPNVCAILPTPVMPWIPSFSVARIRRKRETISETTSLALTWSAEKMIENDKQALKPLSLASLVPISVRTEHGRHHESGSDGLVSSVFAVGNQQVA